MRKNAGRLFWKKNIWNHIEPYKTYIEPLDSMVSPVNTAAETTPFQRRRKRRRGNEARPRFSVATLSPQRSSAVEANWPRPGSKWEVMANVK